MKSKKEQLENRGYLPDEFDADSYNLGLDEKLKLLESSIPTERTMAARLLKDEAVRRELVDQLVTALAIEVKLYPKIEISNTLTFYGEPVVKPLIKVLGRIGSNQHQVVPDKAFNKDSYPLPRDIVSRVIAHIGEPALPELEIALEYLALKQLSEAIDAIGFICFYKACSGMYRVLHKCYLQHSENDLIQWKIIRAFSAFPESLEFLQLELIAVQDNRLRMEIERSLTLIKKRNL